MPSAPCELRRPAWLFAALATIAMFAIALGFAVSAANVYAGASAAAARALAFPAAVGAGLAAGAVGGRLWRRGMITRRDAIWRAIIGFAAVGLAWPASFLLGSFAPGAAHAPTLGGMLAPLAWGAIVGALAGFIGGGAAAMIALTPLAARPSPARPPG